MNRYIALTGAIVLFWGAGLLSPHKLWLSNADVAMAQEPTDAELQELLPSDSEASTSGWGGRAPLSSTASGVSNQFNPAMSVIGLILGTDSNQGEGDFGLQEFELRFTSVIDQNFQADVIFSVHEDIGAAHGHEEEGEHEEEHGADENGHGLEIEQAVVTTTAIPEVSLRFGKFWLPFGKHNLLHTHQFPFITAPVVISDTFGEEALNEIALDATPLLPLPFFSEVNLVVFQGDNEDLFNFATEKDGAEVETRPGPDKAKYLVHWKNLGELGDNNTAEVGLSYLTGTNNTESSTDLTTSSGIDLTYRYKPARGRGRAGLIVQGEWISTKHETTEEDLGSSGYYLSSQWRALESWWLQARYGKFTADVMHEDELEEEDTTQTDLLIAWVPSEFSSLRLQYSEVEHEEEKTGTWYLQYGFVIGAHPAHSY